MRTQIIVLGVALAALTTTASADAPPKLCGQHFDRALDRQLQRVEAATQRPDGQTMAFAEETSELWRLIRAHQSAGCQKATTSKRDEDRLTVQDGWHVYQAVCAPTLSKQLRDRLRGIKAQLRRGKTKAARAALLQLAADLSRDPQFGECKRLANRVDALMIEDMPRLFRQITHAEQNTATQTAGR